VGEVVYWIVGDRAGSPSRRKDHGGFEDRIHSWFETGLGAIDTACSSEVIGLPASFGVELLVDYPFKCYCGLLYKKLSSSR